MNTINSLTNPSQAAKIWQIVTMIPTGHVCSYGKVADLAGLPGRARYVSRALKLAPESLTLPWHRVVNSQGKISLPFGSPVYQQQISRLREEGVTVHHGRVNMTLYQWRPDIAALVLDIPF